MMPGSETATRTVAVELTEDQHRLCQRLSDLNGMSIAQIIEAAAAKGLQTLATDILREAETGARSA